MCTKLIPTISCSRVYSIYLGLLILLSDLVRVITSTLPILIYFIRRSLLFFFVVGLYESICASICVIKDWMIYLMLFCFRDIHVIQLYSDEAAKLDDNTPVEVTIEIKPRPRRPIRHVADIVDRNILLVLTSNYRTRWILRSLNVQGDLDIIVGFLIN